jgi:hypothetical protein
MNKSNTIINWWIEAGCPAYTFDDVPIYDEEIVL